MYTRMPWEIHIEVGLDTYFSHIFSLTHRQGVHYRFDSCYGDTTTQTELYRNEIKPLVMCPLNGNYFYCYSTITVFLDYKMPCINSTLLLSTLKLYSINRIQPSTGQNASCFAYGPTGAGKTHTMQGMQLFKLLSHFREHILRCWLYKSWVCASRCWEGGKDDKKNTFKETYLPVVRLIPKLLMKIFRHPWGSRHHPTGCGPGINIIIVFICNNANTE